jgi:hypothetical protein
MQGGARAQWQAVFTAWHRLADDLGGDDPHTDAGAEASTEGAAMSWSALFGVFLLSHLVGDFLLQTDWQASTKQHGLIGGSRENRRALASHGLTYTCAFIPALVWIGVESGGGTAIAAAALIGIPHVIVDDGLIVGWWIRKVKHVTVPPSTVVRLGVDQSAHVLALAAVVLLVTA